MTKRKTNGVVRRGKSWAVVLDLGDQIYRQCPTCRRRYWTRDGVRAICDRDGMSLSEPASARRQQWLSGFPTKLDAQAAADEKRTEVRQRTYVPRSGETVGEYLTTWLDSRSNLRPTTRENYGVLVNHYVVPRIGATKLTELSASMLDGLYSELLGSGSRTHGPLRPKTVRNVHLVLHRALGTAVKARKLTFNPADGCDAVPAAESHQSREKRMREQVWSPADLRKFLRSVEDDRLYAAWLLLATTGLRRGEALGLPWSAVSLDDGTIHIEQALVVLGGNPAITEVKTDSSAAEMTVDTATVAALREHRKAQAAEQLAWGPAYDPTGLVFTQEDGKPIHPDRFLNAFKSHAKKAGLRPIRVHDLRHSYASALLSAGLPMKVISERLRHAGISITADLYTHLSPELDRAAAETGAAFILGATS